jgi:voltage-gated potassium channel
VRGVFARFLENPASMRYASVAIITVTAVMTVMGAVIIRVFDRDEYATMGEALWFTLQTVTTVGYGDNTPENVIGRLVAAVVMLTSIGLITVSTAIITSTFVGAARKRTDAVDAADEQSGIDALARLESAIQELGERLERIESQSRHTEPSDGD